MKKIASFVGLIGLAACGGSGGPVTTAAELNNSINELNELAEISRASDRLTVQPAGDATYSGTALAFAGTLDAPGFGAVGDLNVKVDFDGALEGAATDFILIEDPGQLNFDDDALDASQFVEAGRLEGQFDLTGDAFGASEPGVFEVRVDGLIEGDGGFLELDDVAGEAFVLGSNQEIITVAAETELTFDGEPGFGLFVAIGGQ